MRGADGGLRVIDLVAGPWPAAKLLRDPLISGWIERVTENPEASPLPPAPDREL